MRNFLVIVKREYLERVRTRSFLILTLLVPGIMTVVMMLPAKLASMGVKAQHIVVVTSTPQLGDMVRQRFLSALTATDEEDESSPDANAAKPKAEGEDEYVIDVDSNATEAERAALRDKVSSQAIDGYLWLSDDAIASGKVTWTSRNMGGFGESSRLSAALNRVIEYERLAKNGLTSEKSDELLKPVKVEAIRIERGKEAKGSGGGKFLEVFIMVMLLYMAVLLYGISVMRSVLEEKTSRILEVLLSSATSTELMAGKLLGVGAVGLTQILVWVVIAGVFESHMPVSQTSAKSASRSRLLASRNGTKFFDPTSSSPSMTMVMSTGNEPVTDFQARQASMKVINWPLSSSAPRATMIFRPSAWSAIAGSNGGRCQRSSGSTGCTS